MAVRSIAGFPETLQRLRERRRMSRAVLSELCGLSRNTIARFERGERIPRLDQAIALANFFGVSLDYLCNGGEKNFLH